MRGYSEDLKSGEFSAISESGFYKAQAYEIFMTPSNGQMSYQMNFKKSSTDKLDIDLPLLKDWVFLTRTK